MGEHVLDVCLETIFGPADVGGDPPKEVVLHGGGLTSKGFKPLKAVASVDVAATYGGAGQKDRTLHREFVKTEDVHDVLLAGMGFDGDVMWPPPENDPDKGDCCAECHASRTGEGIPFAAFAHDSLGCGISFPPIRKEVSVSVAIRHGLLDSIARVRDLPPGYDEAPKRVAVKVRLALIGPELR